MDKKHIESHVKAAHDYCWRGNGGGQYIRNQEDALQIAQALKSEGYDVETSATRNHNGDPSTYVYIKPR